MANGMENDREDRAAGPTYKSLFIGACSLIGVAFGWWFTGFISTYEFTNKVWEQRISALEIRDTEAKWTFRIQSEEIARLKEQVRQLELEHRHESKEDQKPKTFGK